MHHTGLTLKELSEFHFDEHVPTSYNFPQKSKGDSGKKSMGWFFFLLSKLFRIFTFILTLLA